jgi:RimJ/RimL family protein N-acetyltransferase
MIDDVLLRDVTDDDIPIFFAHQQDPEATQRAAFPTRERKAFIVHWKKILVDETVAVKTILFEGHVAGNIVSFEREGKREVGYWIGREYWGKGIATKALSKFLGHVETRPLYAHVVKHNVASIRVLEKCGFSISVHRTVFDDALGEEIEEVILELL